MRKRFKVKSYTPVAFQQASIDAISNHFSRGNSRALCADEAGLGKTIIARGVIEEMAREKVSGVVDDYKDRLKTWWANFCKEDFSLSNAELNKLRQQAVKGFIESVTGTKWEKDKRLWKDALKSSDVDKKIAELNDADAVIGFLQKLIELYTYDTATNHSSDRAAWDTPLKNVSELGLRVLYICCNLAVAEQNSKKLTPVPQCSIRSSKDKPDRLSVLWYYLLGFSTPYAEIYPITATLTTQHTPGNENELKKLEMLRKTREKQLQDKQGVQAEEASWLRQPLVKPKNAKDTKEEEREAFMTALGKLREDAEDLSLKLFKPDLIIFDEFQNFTDIIHLVDMDDEQFEEALKKINQTADSRTAEADPESGDDDVSQYDKQKNAEALVDTLKRCRRIVRALMKGDSQPKLLMLSATPFHAEPGKKGDLNKIAYESLIRFMQKGTSNEPTQDWMALKGRELSDYLYQLGIFRNERARLMQKNNHAYHLIECSGTGLLSRAKALRQETGKRAVGIVMTTPELSCVGSVYPKQYLYASENMPEHGKYTRLKDIIFAPCADDVRETERAFDYQDADIGRLLWIPPVDPSGPLGDVFARYRCFSKTLVFSNLRVIPVSLCSCLRKDSPVQGCTLDDSIKTYLAENVFSLFPDQKTALAECFTTYLQCVGGRALGEQPTRDQVIAYIENGRLADVVKEYAELGCSGEDLKLALDGNYINSPFYAMDAAELMKSDQGSNVRRSFNSPFYPFVLLTTSIGAEGLDYHQYCDRLVHYTKPSGVVQLEQKNGRIDRYGSLAQRRWWASPGNRFRLTHGILARQETASGGMIPKWDAGEGNLHYYFLYTRYTSERDALEDLFREQKNYREKIGINGVIEDGSLDLCPLHRR